MFDPLTVAFEIKSLFVSNRIGDWKYRRPIVTVWHKDPCQDGTDDSCGWFKRARHGDKAVLKEIESRFRLDWDGEYGGWFQADGQPRFSPMGIALQMFWAASYHHFGKNRRRTNRFVARHLFDILSFAENGFDSLHPSIVGRYGITKRDQRIEEFASIIYGCVLRWTLPWWKHPRFHVWHWRLQVHPWQKLRRWLFERCARCGKGYRWGYFPIGNWSGDKTWHHECDQVAVTDGGKCI